METRMACLWANSSFFGAFFMMAEQKTQHKFSSKMSHPLSLKMCGTNFHIQRKFSVIFPWIKNSAYWAFEKKEKIVCRKMLVFVWADCWMVKKSLRQKISIEKLIQFWYFEGQYLATNENLFSQVFLGVKQLAFAVAVWTYTLHSEIFLLLK